MYLSPPAPNCRAEVLAAAAAGGALSPGMLAMLNVSLSMRQYSPKVQMLRTLAEHDAPGACGDPPMQLRAEV